MDRNIRIIGKLEQAFEPYCIIFKELRGVGGRKQLTLQCLQRK